MKIVSLVGARPQFIKEAVIGEDLKKRGIKEVLVNSGQHYDFNMSDVFFQTLNIRTPDYNLNIKSENHGEMTAKIMIKFEKIVKRENPDIILVYGDTNTTLAGAIVGVKLGIKIAHIESGVRSYPFDTPEEINRVLTDKISTYLFCSSIKAKLNLQKEGINKNVYYTGDVLYDLYLKMRRKFKLDLIKKLNLKEDKYIVTTIHRDFNVDRKKQLKKILVELNKLNKKIEIVFPIHPRTKKRIDEFSLKEYLADLKVINPLDYLDLMGLVSKASFIVTDSGGLQKEAYYARKRVAVLMPDTGWIELIDNGWNKLCNSNNLHKVAFNDKEKYISSVYGEGDSGKKIVDFLLNNFGNTR